MSSIPDMADRVATSAEIVLRLDEDCDPAELTAALREHGLDAVHIDRAAVTSKDTLLHALYQGLRFPGYFGFTWDALKDTLTCLKGETEKGFILVFHDLGLLERKDREELRETLAEANEVRAEAGLPVIRACSIR